MNRASRPASRPPAPRPTAPRRVRLHDRGAPAHYGRRREADDEVRPALRAPDPEAARRAQRTQRIRIGHGVVLLPDRFNHPIRVAERAAALDILSDGRLEFGTGRSSQYEQAGFGIDTELSRAMWQESLEMIPRMWTEDPFEHHGRFVSVPARSILPKPVQKPHPPIWMAATSPASWEIA